MTEKTLYLHAGGTKTGSSALQNFLEINASRLEDHGFAYEHRLNIKSGNQITSGNGKFLYETLETGLISEAGIDDLLLSYFGQSINAICSCEHFSWLEESNWKKLLESAKRINVNVKVVFYIRNIIPFLLSSYDQVIKRSGEFRSFDEWINQDGCNNVRAIKTLKIIVDNLSKSNIKVLHYDQESTRLISSFFNALGIYNLFDISILDIKVNRSLSKEERDVLITVNRALGLTFSEELSDFFIYTYPNLRTESPTYDKKTKEFLLDLFSNEVDWVNNTFFNGKSVVSVLPMESDIKQDPNLMLKQTQNSTVEKQVLDWALKKLKHIQNETECRILDSLNNAVSQNASKNYPPEMPADFDALTYLLLNPDVLHAGMDAIQHYINHGKSEGRRYRFKKKSYGSK
jgi:hypothetical protein